MTFERRYTYPPRLAKLKLVSGSDNFVRYVTVVPTRPEHSRPVRRDEVAQLQGQPPFQSSSKGLRRRRRSFSTLDIRPYAMLYRRYRISRFSSGQNGLCKSQVH